LTGYVNAGTIDVEERLMLVLASSRRGVLPGQMTGRDLGKKRPPGPGEQTMTVHHFVPRRSCLGDGPAVDVTAWRRCRLLEAGFPEELAGRLAADRDVDVHELLALVDRGCPPHLAARILSPLLDPWVLP
jgi:hypothetical protein